VLLILKSTNREAKALPPKEAKVLLSKGWKKNRIAHFRKNM
jgi:hypothetical protein